MFAMQPWRLKPWPCMHSGCGFYRECPDNIYAGRNIWNFVCRYEVAGKGHPKYIGELPCHRPALSFSVVCICCKITLRMLAGFNHALQRPAVW